MARRVVLVCGPPCAGKSTYVAERAGESDLVVDYDQIARKIDPSRQWDHTPVTRGMASYERQRLERAAANLQDGTAWVIRTAADPGARGRIARSVGATEVVVVDPGRDVAAQRARSDGRPPWTLDVIDQWYGTTQ